MGNNICQCKTICQDQKERDLSFANKSAHFLIKENNLDTISSNKIISKKIRKIYINNCARKIAKAYLSFKNRKIKRLKKEKDNKEISYMINYLKYNNKKEKEKRKEKENIDDDLNDKKNEIFNDYSLNNPFFIDKVHSSKTSYEKFNIPKINNGKSLEVLNKKASDYHIKVISNKKNKNKNKIKDIYCKNKSISNISTNH